MKSYKLEDFYPDCVLPDCPTQGIHQHILPKQRQIQDSITKYLYCQGGVGSAKSIAFAVKCVWLSLTIPENEGVVCRKNYKDLYKSSWRDIKFVLKRLTEKGIIEKPIYSQKTQGDYSKIEIRETGSILYAIQGKNWSDALGSSYGWFWVDDAMESFEELFIGDDTSAGLLSRLRIPAIHFDRNTYDPIEREHGSLHGMVSSNPPPIGHWLHKLFGTKEGIHKIGEDSVEWIMTSTTDNPFTGAGYAKGIIAAQAKMGRSQGVVRRVIFGESIPAYGGLRVFPQFDPKRHVAPLSYVKGIPLIAGYDFGYHHPAVVYSMLFKCSKGFNHYFSLSEVSEAFAVYIGDFYEKYVKVHEQTFYKNCSLLLNAGDRAGYRKSDTDKDRRGPMRILMADYSLSFKWRYLDLANSLDYMRKLLNTTCPCGKEIILISPKCKVLIGALEGGYKYPRSREGKVGEKPVEDRYFADVACAWRYGAENFVKLGIPSEVRDVYKAQSQEFSSFQTMKHPWSWMEQSDSQFAELITR